MRHSRGPVPDTGHAPAVAGRSGALRGLLAPRRALVVPGVYDAFTAHLAARAGFRAVYLSGASLAYTRLGRPDIGLVSMTEVADVAALICDRVGIPLIVDGDTGFGNALNTQRAIRMFERAGAAAIQLEDQTFPKRCGHLGGKTVVAPAEMVGKIKAAVDARVSEDFVVIARTDALAIEGLDAAMDRARLYAEAGADLLFVEAPRSHDQLTKIGSELGDLGPLVANMVEGGDTPALTADELGQLGFSVVLFPGGTVRAIGLAAQNYFRSLAEHGTTTPYRGRMFDFTELNAVIGTPDMIERGKAYEASDAPTEEPS